MLLSSIVIEQLAGWFAKSDTIADARAAARRVFFGYDDRVTVSYMTGAEDMNSRERRFLGWFGFSFQ